MIVLNSDVTYVVKPAKIHRSWIYMYLRYTDMYLQLLAIWGSFFLTLLIKCIKNH